MPKHKGPSPQDLYWQRKHAQEAFLPPGLPNHGNTCFMNSVLQGLIATHLLADLVLFNDIPESVQKHSNTPLLSRRSPQLTNGHGFGGPYERPWVDMPIGDRFLDIMYRAWSIQSQRKRENLSPKDLLAAVGAKYDQYLDFAQQDAHEFLRILLDAMRMEEQDVIKQRQPLPPKQPKKRPRSTQLTPTPPPPPALPQLAEEDKLISFPDMIFGGKLTSILVCQKCKHISQTYEDFNDISLSLKPEDYVHGRKRDRLKNFAKKLSVFPSSSLTTGMQIQRSSSVPPSPREREDAQLSEKPLPHVVTRRRSMEHLQSDQRVPTADSGDQPGDVKETMTTESDGSNVIVNEVSATEEKHIEFVEEEKKEKDRDKEKKKKDAEDSWAKLGRRISMTVSLGKKKKRKSGTGDSPTSRKVSTTSVDISPQTPPKSSVQPSFESTSPLSPPPHPTVASPSPSLPETKVQQLLPPPVVHPTPVRASSSPSHSLPRLGTHQRSKSPKPLKQTPEEQAYLRRILADVVPSSISSSGGNGNVSPLSRLKQTSHHLHLPGTSVNGKSSGSGVGGDTSSASTGTTTTASAGLWLPLGVSQFSGLEECLRMFTAVEVLDGENMVGCRRCWKIANGVYEKREEEDSDDEAEEDEDENKEGEAVPLQSIGSSSSIGSNVSHISYTEHGYERGNRPTTLTRGYTHPSSVLTPTLATNSMTATPRVPPPPSSVSLPSQSEAPYNDPTTPTTAAYGYRAMEPLRTPGGLPIPSIDISGTASEVLEMDMSAAGDRREESLSSSSSVGEGQPRSVMGPLAAAAAASWDSLVVPATSVLGKKGGKKRRSGSGDGTSPSASASASSAEESEMTSGSGSGEEESDGGSASSAISDVIVGGGGGGGGGGVGNGMVLAASPPPHPPPGLGHASIANANSVTEKPPPKPKPKSRPKKKKETMLRPAYKRYLISVPPPVLVIHMKRFQQMHSSGSPLSFSAFSSSIAEKLAAGFSGGGNGGSGGSGSPGGSSGGVGGGGLSFGLGFGGMGGFKKLEEFVSFPEWLDLGPFLAPKKEEFGLSKSKGRSKKGKGGGNGERCMYRLYAVVVHIGNMLGGHYVAYTALPSEPPWASGRKAENSGEMETKEQQQQSGAMNGVGEGPVSSLTLVPSSSSSSASLATGGQTSVGETMTEVSGSAQSVRGDGGNGGGGDQRARRQWAYISDTNVRIVPLEEVLNARAYLCMYERV